MTPYIDFVVYGILPTVLAVALPGIGNQVGSLLVGLKAARDAANEGFEELIAHAEAGTVPTAQDRQAYTERVRAKINAIQALDTSAADG